MELIELLQYGFVQRAFFAGVPIAIACASLGLFLVLRKMSLIGDGLSHVSFGALALGMLVGIYPFYLAIPLVVIASLLILQISQRTRVYGDAAIGIVSAVGIASGMIFTSLSQGFNVDLFSYLFGSILTVSWHEVIMAILLSFAIMGVLAWFYWDLFAVTFDETYARTLGIKVDQINSLLTILTAITVVLSIKLVGIMLVSALLILPAVTALQLAQQFRMALLISGLVAIISVLIGIIAALSLDLPAGATIVIVNAFGFVVAVAWRKLG